MGVDLHDHRALLGPCGVEAEEVAGAHLVREALHHIEELVPLGNDALGELAADGVLGAVDHAVEVDELALTVLTGGRVDVAVVGSGLEVLGDVIVAARAGLAAVEREAEVGARGLGVGAGDVVVHHADGVDERVDLGEVAGGADELGKDEVAVRLDPVLDAGLGNLLAVDAEGAVLVHEVVEALAHGAVAGLAGVVADLLQGVDDALHARGVAAAVER